MSLLKPSAVCKARRVVTVNASPPVVDLRQKVRVLWVTDQNGVEDSLFNCHSVQ